jgi:hypothetical protein
MSSAGDHSWSLLEFAVWGIAVKMDYAPEGLVIGMVGPRNREILLS